MNKYGWVRDIPSLNDPNYQPPLMMDTPPSVDLRPDFPAVFSQGTIGSCTAQALSGVISYREKKKGMYVFVPSRLFIYYNERVLMGTTASDSGASMRTGIRSLAAYGYCREDILPYEESKFKTKPPRAAYRIGLGNRITTALKVKQTLSDLKAALAAGDPVVFGFTVYSGFESKEVKESGLLHVPTNEEMIGGHAVCLVGYDDSDNTFLVRNSWGPEWGLGGYFKMPFDYVCNPNLAADFWTLPSR